MAQRECSGVWRGVGKPEHFVLLSREVKLGQRRAAAAATRAIQTGEHGAERGHASRNHICSGCLWEILLVCSGCRAAGLLLLLWPLPGHPLRRGQISHPIGSDFWKHSWITRSPFVVQRCFSGADVGAVWLKEQAELGCVRKKAQRVFRVPEMQKG